MNRDNEQKQIYRYRQQIGGYQKEKGLRGVQDG